MRALLTGASSFTGYWLAEALLARGAEVVAPLRGAKSGGGRVREERIRRLAGRCRLVAEAPMGSARLADLAADGPPFDLLWLHGAEVGDFRRAGYHPLIATAATTAGVGALMDAARCPAVAATGSVFEAEEGRGDRPGAIGAYGLAKTLAWQVIRFEAARRGLALRKLVIAHPFGPLEKDGLTQAMLEAWRRGQPALLRHPWLVRDFLPVTALAAAAAGWATTVAGDARLSPSGFVEPVGAFAARLAGAMRPRLGLACAVEAAPLPSDEPGTRIGLDRLDDCGEVFWDAYADHKLTFS